MTYGFRSFARLIRTFSKYKFSDMVRLTFKIHNDDIHMLKLRTNLHNSMHTSHLSAALLRRTLII